MSYYNTIVSVSCLAYCIVVLHYRLIRIFAICSNYYTAAADYNKGTGDMQTATCLKQGVQDEVYHE
jgi:hypothetical protein